MKGGLAGWLGGLGQREGVGTLGWGSWSARGGGVKSSWLGGCLSLKGWVVDFGSGIWDLGWATL